MARKNFTIGSLLQYKSENGGSTNGFKDEDYWISKTKQENQIKILLAGKAATEVLFGILDMGAKEDLVRALRILDRHLEENWEYDFKARTSYSSNTHQVLRNHLVHQKELKRLYNCVMKILINNKEFLIEVKKELLKKEFITKDDIENIKDRVKIVPVSQIYMFD